MSLTLKTWVVRVSKVGSLVIAVVAAAMWLALLNRGFGEPGGMIWVQLTCHTVVAAGSALILEKREGLTPKTVLFLMVGGLVNLMFAALLVLAIFFNVT